jgi:hypothetical protein
MESDDVHFKNDVITEDGFTMKSKFSEHKKNVPP